jgi:hypothetical protein
LRGAARPPPYERHRPEQTTLYRLVQQHAAHFIAHTAASTGAELPRFIKEEFDAFLECGILAHGFLRLRCGECGHGIRYHGVLAPNARLRPLVVPQESEVQERAAEVAVAGECDVQTVQSRPHRISWARLQKRVFCSDIT